MRPRQLHRSSTVVLSALMALIGVALVAQDLGGGGSVLAPRLLLGLLFMAAGVGRIYVEARRGRGTRSRENAAADAADADGNSR